MVSVEAIPAADEMLFAMDRAGIDRAVVFPFNEAEPGLSFARCNNYIAAETGRHPDRLTGFCRLDPNAGHAAVEELERCVGELGLKGVKLHPSSQNFPLDHPVLDELEQVFVASEDLDAESLSHGVASHAAQDIVGFISLDLQPGDVKGIDKLADALDLGVKVTRHLRSCAFISGEKLIPEGPAGIE